MVGGPKPPTLKLTAAGLAFIPNPPKLKPPAVVLTAPSPPKPAKGPARTRWRDTERKRESRVSIERAASRKTVKPKCVSFS